MHYVSRFDLAIQSARSIQLLLLYLFTLGNVTNPVMSDTAVLHDGGVFALKALLKKAKNLKSSIFFIMPTWIVFVTLTSFCSPQFENSCKLFYTNMLLLRQCTAHIRFCWTFLHVFLSYWQQQNSLLMGTHYLQMSGSSL